jgi:hypothetical protein
MRTHRDLEVRTFARATARARSGPTRLDLKAAVGPEKGHSRSRRRLRGRQEPRPIGGRLHKLTIENLRRAPRWDQL